MYQFILLIHVLTAIIGFGQTFLFPLILKLPKNSAQIHFVGKILSKMGTIAKYSDYILLITGIIMIFIGKFHFQVGWINLSLILFIFMRFSSSFLSKKVSNELFHLMSKEENKIEIAEFEMKRKNFMPKLYITQSINFFIIIIMILKPTISILSF